MPSAILLMSWKLCSGEVTCTKSHPAEESLISQYYTRILSPVTVSFRGINTEKQSFDSYTNTLEELKNLS